MEASSSRSIESTSGDMRSTTDSMFSSTAPTNPPVLRPNLPFSMLDDKPPTLLHPIMETPKGALSRPTTEKKRKEVYKFEGRDLYYACAWSNKVYNDNFRLAAGTVMEDDDNFNKNKIVVFEFDEQKNEVVEKCSFHHGFPATSMHFNPSRFCGQEGPEIIATTSSGLRLFRYDVASKSATLESTLNSKPYNPVLSAGCAYTCMDWLEHTPEMIATSCIDSTCSLWNIEYGVEINRFTVKPSMRTQLIAHEQCVNSIAFANMEQHREQFATASKDGSVRLFDARNLTHSTILYDDPQRRSLNHLAWNRQEPYCIAIVPENSTECITLDIRKLQVREAMIFNNHKAVINGVAWAPQSAIHLCTVCADGQALIWQTDHGPREEPILAYKTTNEISNVRWSKTQGEWMAITCCNVIEILRV